MSFSAHVKLSLVSRDDYQPLKILEVFLSAGWIFNYFDKIEYLPKGDGDDYDWQFAALEEWPAVLKILEEKSALGENVALGLMYQDSPYGASFIVTPEGIIWVFLFAERVELASTA